MKSGNYRPSIEKYRYELLTFTATDTVKNLLFHVAGPSATGLLMISEYVEKLDDAIQFVGILWTPGHRRTLAGVIRSWSNVEIEGGVVLRLFGVTYAGRYFVLC